MVGAFVVQSRENAENVAQKMGKTISEEINPEKYWIEEGIKQITREKVGPDVRPTDPGAPSEVHSLPLASYHRIVRKSCICLFYLPFTNCLFSSFEVLIVTNSSVATIFQAM